MDRLDIARTHGSVPLPENWEVRIQYTLLEPEGAVAAEGGGFRNPAEVQRPRSNVVLSRQFVDKDQSPFEDLAEFQTESMSAIPGLEVVRDAELVEFDDGVTGAGIEITFQATPEVRLRQLHLFRRDGDAPSVVTQIVVTAEAGFADGPDGASEDWTRLTRIARGFRSGGTPE